MSRIVIYASAVLLGAAWTTSASAQYVPPGGSPLPVELEYFRPQQGVLDNYNQFVAPRYQLNNQLRQLDRQQKSSFRTLDERIRQNSDQIRESTAAPTGTAAGFMNYSHYYGIRGGGGRRR